MNLPKVLYHLNNWLYHSIMEKWFAAICGLFDLKIWYHRTRRDYYLEKAEKAEARIIELDAELERILNEPMPGDK